MVPSTKKKKALVGHNTEVDDEEMQEGILVYHLFGVLQDEKWLLIEKPIALSTACKGLLKLGSRVYSTSLKAC